MKKYFGYLLNFIIAGLFLYCLSILYYNNSIYAIYQNYNILTFFLYFGIYYILFIGQSFWGNMDKRKGIFVILGFLYSLFLVLGTNLMLYGAVELSSFFEWLCVFVFAYVISSFIIILYECIIPQIMHLCSTVHSSIIDFFYTRTTFLKLWILIFLCWLPVLLAFYPGIFAYDAKAQCSQVAGTLSLTAHHPVIHTLFLGGSVWIGQQIFSSANLGFLAYSLIQMLINSAVFACCLCFIKRNKVKPLPFFACFAFFAFMPFNSIFSVCATKDSIFGALFLLLMIIICQSISNRNIFFKSWKYPSFFIMVCFMLLIFRNNMIYAYVLCVPFFAVLFRKHLKYMIAMLLVPILLFQVYKAVLYPALQVIPGNSREAYSVIMQQFANVYNNCELDQDESELLCQLMDDSAWKKYEPHRADVIKDQFNTEVFESNFSEYIKLWCSLGMHHPSQYLNAFFNLTYGYWYPNDVLPDETTYRKYIEIYDGGDITFDSKFPWLFKKLRDFGMESSYQNIPGISIIFSPAVYVWILLFLAAISIYRRNYKFFNILLMPAAFFLTILLGPVSLLRYLYPIILCVPMLCVTYSEL